MSRWAVALLALYALVAAVAFDLCVKQFDVEGAPVGRAAIYVVSALLALVWPLSWAYGAAAGRRSRH